MRACLQSSPVQRSASRGYPASRPVDVPRRRLEQLCFYQGSNSGEEGRHGSMQALAEDLIDERLGKTIHMTNTMQDTVSSFNGQIADPQVYITSMFEHIASIKENMATKADIDAVNEQLDSIDVMLSDLMTKQDKEDDDEEAEEATTSLMQALFAGLGTGVLVILALYASTLLE